jgi:hypothetical protein
MFILAKAMTIIPIIWLLCFHLSGLSNPDNPIFLPALLMIFFDAFAVYFWWWLCVAMDIFTYGIASPTRALLATALCIVTSGTICLLLILQHFQVGLLLPVSSFFHQHLTIVSIIVFLFSFFFVEWVNKIREG